MAIVQLDKLVSNISDSVGGLIDDLQGNSKSGIPEYPTTKSISPILSTINPESWKILRFPYTFSVIDLNGSGLEESPFQDFELPLAPQAITQSEEFAISIKPTFGGTVVTHSGNRYKNLQLKGTTGLHPFRGAGGVNARTGEAIFQPKKLKYHSGYRVFLEFRNWLRAYVEFKKANPEEAKGLRLIFKNFKDGELLIVEITSFQMSRQAAQSFLYDYDINFRVIAPFQSFEIANRFTNLQDSLARGVELIDQSRGVFLRTQDILRQIESTYSDIVLEPLRKINLTVKALLGIGTVAADIGERIIQNTLSTSSALALTLGIKSQQDANQITGTLDPRLSSIPLPADISATLQREGAKFLNTFNEGLMAIESAEFPEIVRESSLEEQQTLLTAPRSFYEETAEELIRVKNNAEDFFGLGSSTFDAIFDRTSTLNAVSTKVITSEELELLNAFNSALQGINLILASEELFRSDFDERIADLIERFDGELNFRAQPAVREVILKDGDTLERLAQKYLLDSVRWGEIAELNFLIAPYITSDLSSTSTSRQVLKTGDKILIPTSLENGFSSVPQGKETEVNKNLSEVLKSLGTDLRLDKNFDLILSPTGDFELISGTDNIAQAVILKLSYEKGELIRYPEIGADIVIGSKFPPLLVLRDGIIDTLTADPRIERVDDLRLRQDNSELSVEFGLVIKNVDIPVPISIPIS